MALTKNELVSTLNVLIEVCKDGEEGFKGASEGVTDRSIKSLFLEYSQQRAQFAKELQNEVRLLNSDPEKSGSIAGSLHRGWIDLKSAVTGRDEHAILAECERGEDSAVKNYKEALEKAMPGDLTQLLQSQYAAVTQAHDRVRNLRNSRSTAKA